jgi:hypothetical protein
MSEKQNKWVEAITKLIKYTQEGKIKWLPGSHDKEIGRDDLRMESVFITKYKDSTLRLYKYSFKVEEPGLLDSFSTVFSIKKLTYPYWTSSIALEFIGENGKNLWTFPSNNALNDLLEAVRYQVAGVDDFLNDILQD